VIEVASIVNLLIQSTILQNSVYTGQEYTLDLKLCRLQRNAYLSELSNWRSRHSPRIKWLFFRGGRLEYEDLNFNNTGNVRITWIEAHSRNHCCHGKAISITHCECVSVALGIQHAMRMRRTVIGGLSGSTVFFFSRYKRHDFRKKKNTIEHKMCVSTFTITFFPETFG
jgi:hypothetical protein